MGDPTPIDVPEALAPLAERDPSLIDVLRDMRVALEARCDMDERTMELVRLGAFIGLDAPGESFRTHVRRARAGGVSEDEIWDVVLAVAPLVGVPRLLSVIPSIAAALEPDDGE